MLMSSCVYFQDIQLFLCCLSACGTGSNLRMTCNSPVVGEVQGDFLKLIKITFSVFNLYSCHISARILFICVVRVYFNDSNNPSYFNLSQFALFLLFHNIRRCIRS